MDDAREAAREFVEFCRGRMWVFTDAGTTASGEKLYAFTHRTFLEYFTAAYLAYASDTPEALAGMLAVPVSNREWTTVGELAVQIKDRTSEGGAQRVFDARLRRHARDDIWLERPGTRQRAVVSRRMPAIGQPSPAMHPRSHQADRDHDTRGPGEGNPR